MPTEEIEARSTVTRRVRALLRAVYPPLSAWQRCLFTTDSSTLNCLPIWQECESLQNMYLAAYEKQDRVLYACQLYHRSVGQALESHMASFISSSQR